MGQAYVATQVAVDSGDEHQMKISLISRDNGAGLSTDMALLEDIFVSAGHEVIRVDWTARSMDQCDVGIFLELLQPKLLKHMTYAIGIFNMEWFMIQWRRYLNNMNQLWAKGQEAHDVFNQLGLGKKSHLTGFASRDFYRPGVVRKDQCLHLKGHSDLKNTPAVLEAWRRNPDLPHLVVVSNNDVPDMPSNASLLRHVPTDKLIHLMNESYVHLCTSRSEGWGHYITEGLSTGAMVITTNASPMKEHMSSEWGMLVEPSAKHRRGMVHEYDVDPDSIAESVFRAMSLTQADRNRRSALARGHVAWRNQQFKNIALKLLGEL